MNRKVKLTFGVIMVAFIILGITNPGNADPRFTSWLEREHGIYCTYDGNLRACKQIIDNTEKIITNKSGKTTNTGFYTEYRRNITFEDGEKTEIRALGILTMFFNQ
ncbi:hypothetical protein [Paenibacillus sp. NPDC057967]|uniref:hypothetical protein n=1 Tax=Paenibacillus sp. NPDC057967 TaxID=3346293 RepID=UPI0036DC2030